MDCLGQFINNLELVAIELDAHGKLLHASDFTLSLFDWSRERVVGRSFYELCASIPMPCPFNPELRAIETSLIDRFGELRVLNWKVQAVSADEELSGYFLTANDRTAEIKLAQKQRAMQSQFEALFKNLPGLLCIKDKDLRYTACNANFARFLGLQSNEQVVGKVDSDLPWSVDVASVFCKGDQSVLEGEAYRNLDGEISEDDLFSTFNIYKIPLKDNNDKIYGLLAFYQDVTEFKQKEIVFEQSMQGAQQEQRLQSDFLANMSHDLKTPLHTVLGMSEILKIKPHAPEQDEYIDGIIHAGNNILRIVEDVLNYSKVEAGKVELHAEAFDLKELIEGIIDSFSAQANEKKLKMIVSYPDSVPNWVKTDSSALRKIIVNLVSNAIKFTQTGHVLISVEEISSDASHTELQISVEDTGIGISEENLDQIFDRFYRIDPSYHGQYKGSGLGLAVSKQLAQSLGGELCVHSRLGTGSTFYCTTRCQLGEVPESLVPKWADNHQDVRVLIVDDLGVRGDATKKQLGGEHTKVVASDQAIAELKQATLNSQAYQIVLVDDEVHGLSFEELAYELKHASHIKTPMLVAFTNPGSLDQKEHLKSLGFTRQLVKPIQPSELSRELAAAWVVWKQGLSQKVTTVKSSGAQPRILLVEDNIFSQKVTKVMLQGLGCEIDYASSGAEALDLTYRKYDVIFMDLGLPDIDGIEVVKKIRHSNNCNRHVFICALTAHASEEEKEKCLEVGMNEFLTKPARLEEFQRIINIAMSQRQKRNLVIA